MNQPCPSCGYCPHCGRGGAYFKPYTPNYWDYPYPYTIYGNTWTSDGVNINMSGNTKEPTR